MSRRVLLSSLVARLVLLSGSKRWTPQAHRRLQSPSQSLSPRLCSSTIQLNLIRASPSRALASLLHPRLEPPVAIVSVSARPPQPELPAKQHHLHCEVCPRRDRPRLANLSASFTRCCESCPRRPTFPLSTTSIAPPRDPVTLACSALLAAFHDRTRVSSLARS
jgi:hypothetical protein